MRILCYVNFTLTEKKKKEQNQGHHRFPLEPLVEIGDRALRIKAQLDDSPRLGDGAGYTAREQQGQTTNQASCLPAQSSFCQRASELPQNQSPAKLSTRLKSKPQPPSRPSASPSRHSLCAALGLCYQSTELECPSAHLPMLLRVAWSLFACHL